MPISDIIRLFPAVIAPAIVYHVRRRYPSLDGLLVWPVVMVVAVVLSFIALFIGGASLTAATAEQATRDGLQLGLAAIGLYYLTRHKEKPIPPPAAPSVNVPPVVAEARPPADLNFEEK